MNEPKPEPCQVRSLSPAAWYIYSPAKAARERGRGQIGRLYATKAEAEAALVRLNAPINFNPFSF